MIDDCGDNSDEQNCSAYTTCDFEEGFCNWRPESIGKAEWKVASYYNSNGPSRDHTTGLIDGLYSIMKANGDAGSKARLVSPVFKTSSRCEFRLFVYVWAKSDVGSFSIFSRTIVNGEEKRLYSTKIRIGEYWDRVVLNITETAPFQVVVEGIASSDFYQVLAFDDTSFDKGCILDMNGTIPTVYSTTTTTTTVNPCGEGKFFQCASNGQCIAAEKVCDFISDCSDSSDEMDCGNCNFEDSLCGWRDESDYDLSWIRQTGPSNNPSGPQIDHTLQNNTGSYLLAIQNEEYGMYLDATLLGPTLGELSEFCTLTLWVHMGPTLFALQPEIDFYVSNASDLYSGYKFLGTIKGPLGNEWKKFKISVGAKPAGFLIDIYAYPMFASFDNVFTDIAIDDIQFENCAVTTIPRNQSLDCTFENDFCDFYLDTTADFFWQRTNFASSVMNTGPGFDRNFFFQFFTKHYFFV